MATALKTLVKATGCGPEIDEDRQAYLERLIAAVLEMPEDDWGKLPDVDQDWVNDGAKALKAGKPIVDPDAQPEEEEEAEEEEAEEEEAKPIKAKKAKPAKASKGKPEKKPKAKEGTTVTKQKATPGASAIFRRAYLLAYLKNDKVKPADVATKLDVTISKAAAGVTSYETRQVVAILRAKKLLS